MKRRKSSDSKLMKLAMQPLRAKRNPVKSPRDMTAGQINKRLDALDKLGSKYTDQMIAAGRGHERYSDWSVKTDPLSLKALAVSQEYQTLQSEIRRRYGPDAPSRLPLKRSKTIRAKRNPSRRGAADEAARRFEEFTGHAATKEFRIQQRPIRTGLAVGKLVGVMYEATRDGATDKYFHRFKKSSQPLLIANHDGSTLGIVGGRFRFTDRGIVDE